MIETVTPRARAADSEIIHAVRTGLCRRMTWWGGTRMPSALRCARPAGYRPEMSGEFPSFTR